MDVSVIIATYNRLDDLTRCLESLTRQTVVPEEIIIVDDGALEAMPYREELEARGSRCRMERKAEKGLTRSRNYGVSLATGEIIAFFDDDVELEPDYIAVLKATYEELADRPLGGVGGVDLKLKPGSMLTKLEYLYDLVFLISPWRPGQISVSGFSEQVVVSRAHPCQELYRADILSGCLFSFHRRVFDKYEFDEGYSHGYCQGEDKDFTAMISKDFELYINPQARLWHHQSPVERVDKFRRGRDYLLSMYAVFVKYRRRNVLQSLLFIYSLVGYFLKKCVAAMVKMRRDELDRLRGILAAFGTIVTGRGGR